jgi:hypothetical protein
MIALRYAHGETSAFATGMKIKVLRRKDQLHVKPTAAEISDLRNRVQDAAVSLPKQGRELDDQIPKHLPIRIKIKKEKEEAFRDLKNEKWLREFELEVKNIGTKPIYFLALMIDLPEVREADGTIGFSVRYGRETLNVFEQELGRAKPEDVPIEPGAIYIFRFAKTRADAWEDFIVKEKRAQPKKVRVRFQELNFGDGTGFRTVEGVPLPEPAKNQSPEGSLRAPQKSNQANHAPPPTKKGVDTEREQLGGLPASFLPARFFPDPRLTLFTPVRPISTRCRHADATDLIAFSCGYSTQARFATATVVS